MAVRLQLRRGTADAWTAANPILAAGEEGHETDTGRRKVGDGVTEWRELAYWRGGDALPPHASTHASGEADALTPSAIGAEAAGAVSGHNDAAAAHPFTAADKYRYGGTDGATTEGTITAAGRALVAGENAAAQRGTLSAYRDQTTAASAEVSGAVTPNFASHLLLQYSLGGNLTSFAEPENLVDGQTAGIWITLGSYAMFAKPDATATAKYGPWTVTGPIVRVGVQRLGSVYYWTAVSF